MAGKDWRDGVLKDLKEEGYIAIESIGILTGKDIQAARDAINQVEANRDEAEEWKHIKDLQREKAARLIGSRPN